LSYRDFSKSRYDKQLKLEIPDKAKLFGYSMLEIACKNDGKAINIKGKIV